MVRPLVAVLHLALASAIALEVTAVLVQMRLNLLWEIGFYRQAAPLTAAVTVLALGLLVLAVCEAISAVGFALSRRWGGIGLVVSSSMLAAIAPGTLGLALVIGVAIVVVETWRERLLAMLPTRDEDDDGDDF